MYWDFFPYYVSIGMSLLWGVAMFGWIHALRGWYRSIDARFKLLRRWIEAEMRAASADRDDELVRKFADVLKKLDEEPC